MFNNITNFLNLISNRKIKTAATIDSTDLIPLGTRDPNYIGGYQPTAIQFSELAAAIGTGGVQSVTDNGGGGVSVNNADPLNPVVSFSGVFVDGTLTGNGVFGNPLSAVYQAPSVDGITITGDGTPGNPLVAAGGGGSVNYANVIFVDGTNGNNGTAVQNDFTKAHQDPTSAMLAATALTPTSTDRTLIYVRRGYYTGGVIVFKDFTDYYFEPGAVLQDYYFLDNGISVESKVFGKLRSIGSPGTNEMIRMTGASSKLVFEFDEIYSTKAAFGIFGGTTATITGRKVFAECLNTGFGMTTRTSGIVSVNITEEFAAYHDVISFSSFSGKFYMACPRIYLHEGNYYGGDFKHVVICRNNSGGEATINGNLIVNNIAGYYAGISGTIGRWTDSNMTLRIYGNLTCENQFGIYGLGTSTGSKTIINGDLKTNNLGAYIANNSIAVFRNGTLINRNTTTGSEAYPVLSLGGSAKYFVENCQMYSEGLGATYPNVSAFWKDTTTAQINVYNTTYSGADAVGFFIRNSAGGQPVNNVRIHNCRSTKPLDTNITDLLAPTGFIQDVNTLAINFI